LNLTHFKTLILTHFKNTFGECRDHSFSGGEQETLTIGGRRSLRAAAPQPRCVTKERKRMKLLVTFVFLAMTFVASVASATQWKTVEKAHYDWNGDRNLYDFVLRAPADYDAGGDFTQLQIMREGKVVLEVNDNDGLAKLADALSSENKKLKKKNILKSKYLLMISSVKGRSKHPLLLLFGWAYGSSPGSLHVIALGDDGIPKEILNLENFEIRSFVDLDKDKIPELIGYPCFSQSWGPGYSFLTYDPFHVYRFGATATSGMTMDLQLTESYNRKNYYGWAGPECSEEIAVVLHPPGDGKPVVMDAEKAKTLFRK
jgi:hypothetical protein